MCFVPGIGSPTLGRGARPGALRLHLKTRGVHDIGMVKQQINNNIDIYDNGFILLANDRVVAGMKHTKHTYVERTRSFTAVRADCCSGLKSEVAIKR